MSVGADGPSTNAAPPVEAPRSPSEAKPSPPPDPGSPGRAKDPGAAEFPDDVRIFVASRLLFEGRLDDAATVASTVVAQRPDCDRGKFILGLIRHKQQRYDDGRPLLEAAMLSKQPYPERDHASYYLAWCCYHMKDLKAAKKYFEIHVSQWPNFDDSHFGLGLIALDENRLANAEAALTTALTLQERIEQPSPADRRSRSKTLARLGDVAARQQKLDIAITRYEAAANAWPDHHEAWAGLAKLYRSAGRESDAKRADDGEREAMARAKRGAPTGAAKGEGGGAATGEGAGGATGEKKPEAPAGGEPPEAPGGSAVPPKPAPSPVKGAD